MNPTKLIWALGPFLAVNDFYITHLTASAIDGGAASNSMTIYAATISASAFRASAGNAAAASIITSLGLTQGATPNDSLHESKVVNQTVPAGDLFGVLIGVTSAGAMNGVTLELIGEVV